MRNPKHLFPGLLVVACAGAALACAAAPATTNFAAAEGPRSEGYIIGTPDLIRVTVWKHPDLSVEMPVRHDGKISVPLLDDVQAAGLTPLELKQVISDGLEKSIRRPNVTVAVVSPDSQVVTVLGGVAEPGVIPLRANMGVVEAVASAGGFSPWANKNAVVVVRVVDGQRKAQGFSYSRYFGGDPDADIFLRPGDVIVVPE